MVLKVLIISGLETESGSIRFLSIERFRSLVKEVLEMAVLIAFSSLNSTTFFAELYFDVVYALVRDEMEMDACVVRALFRTDDFKHSMSI